MEIPFKGKFNIMGHEIDLEKIENPRVVMALKRRKNKFLFNYGDHTDHSEKKYSEYHDHREYHDTAHTDSDHRDYKEYSDCHAHIPCSEPHYYDW